MQREDIHFFGTLFLVAFLFLAVFVEKSMADEVSGEFFTFGQERVLIRHETLYGDCDDEVRLGRDFARYINVPYYGCRYDFCEEAASDQELYGAVKVNFKCRPDQTEDFVSSCERTLSKLCG
jgi:hypothetical protein